jgi:hypothetical protein
MKLKIVQTGYESFTGLLGDVKFEDGVSVKDTTPEQYAYIRAMFVVEEVESGDDASTDKDADAAAEAKRLAIEAARLAAEAERERMEAKAAELAAAQAAEAAEAAADKVSE